MKWTRSRKARREMQEKRRRTWTERMMRDDPSLKQRLWGIY
jgi:hypothetical protein